MLIIHNPVAGRPAAHRSVLRLADGLRRSGWQVDLAGTTGRGHATVLAAEAVAQGYPLVVAAGGDGTVNETIQSLVGTTTALGVLPVGTVNIWAAEAGIPADPDRLVPLLTSGTARSVDVGRAGDRYFLLMAGLGFDAAVVKGVGLALKRRVGRLAYAATVITVGHRYAGTPVTVRLDGRELHCTMLLMVIGNTRRYAGQFRLTPHAIIDDGRLDVCIVPGRHMACSLAEVGAVLTGLPPLRHRLLYSRAASIEIASPPELPLQLDGDFAGFAPLRIEAVPRALRVVAQPGRANGLFTL